MRHNAALQCELCLLPKVDSSCDGGMDGLVDGHSWLLSIGQGRTETPSGPRAKTINGPPPIIRLPAFVMIYRELSRSVYEVGIDGV